MKKATFLFGLTLATAVAVPAMAELPTSPTAGHANVGALLGYGFKDGFNFGLGARGGYTLPMNVYLGGTLIYFFGKSNTVLGQDYSYSVLSLGVEGGYDFYVNPVIIRPFLGLGPDIGMVSCPTGAIACGGGGTKFAAWLGGEVLYPITENWFAGADMRVHIVSDATNFQLFANGGYQF